MPKSALPEGYELGPDNRTWLMRLKKKVQFALAAGPRATGFWKWREIPKILFSIKGKGDYRWENTDGSYIEHTVQPALLWMIRYVLGYTANKPKMYLSRIQPWCRWHISLQWPLFFNCHLIYKQKNVRKYPVYQSSFGITQMITFGIGFKRDSDKVYWLTMNAGGNFE